MNLHIMLSKIFLVNRQYFPILLIVILQLYTNTDPVYFIKIVSHNVLKFGISNKINLNNTIIIYVSKG